MQDLQLTQTLYKRYSEMERFLEALLTKSPPSQIKKDLTTEELIKLIPLLKHLTKKQRLKLKKEFLRPIKLKAKRHSLIYRLKQADSYLVRGDLKNSKKTLQSNLKLLRAYQ